MKSFSLNNLISDSFILLLLGLGTIQFFISNIVVNILVLIFISFYAFYSALKKKEYGYFYLVLLIYVTSHFMYSPKEGGTFNLVAFISISIYIIHKKVYLKKYYNNIISFLVLMFLITNIISWIYIQNIPPLITMVGIVSMLGYLLTFYYLSIDIFTIKKYSLFLKITIILATYMVIISYLKRYNVINFHNPLFGWTERQGSARQAGTFVDSELFAEYGLLSFILLFSAYSLKKYRNLNITNLMFILGFISTIFIIILTNSRSAFLLLLSYLLFTFLFSIKNVVYKFDRLINFSVLGLLLLAVFFIYPYFTGYEQLQERLQLIDLKNINEKTIITGESLNRGATWEFGIQRIKERHWIFGYGWRDYETNREAWLGTNISERTDAHSLYLSLIPSFGWIGSVFYVLLFLYSIRLQFKIFNITKDKFIKIMSITFILILSFFLINEVKINCMRHPSYFMITWIWLGLSYSFYNTFKYYGKIN